jgi:hypothetical protein
MNLFKSIGISYILPVLAVLGVVYGCKQANTTNMQLCNHQFALCTSAICIPQPGDSTKAICFCDVEEQASMATVPCNRLQPSTDDNGIRTVYSTFSLEQFKQGKKGMQCPNGTPWTWCLNKPCTVNPSNPKKAICTCDVVRSGEWMTLGGDCDTSTCQTGYWSGAAMQDFEQGNVFMTKAFGLDKSPAKWCQADSP